MLKQQWFRWFKFSICKLINQLIYKTAKNKVVRE